MPESLYPEVTVGAVLLNPEGQIFLFRSHKWRNRYAIPGGHIELGESAVAAVIRETLEETGLTVTEAHFLCYQEAIFDPAFWERRHFVFLDFVCYTPGGPVRLNEEAESWTWVATDDILNWPLEPFSQRTLQVFLQRQAEFLPKTTQSKIEKK